MCFHRTTLGFVAAIAVVGASVAVGVAVGLAHLELLGPVRGVYFDRATRWTFAGGVAGYALLALGLANSTFLFSMGRPWHVVIAIAPGLATSVLVGGVLTSAGPYYHAVIGMAAGALVFALITARGARATLRRADYWGYAAY